MSDIATDKKKKKDREAAIAAAIAKYGERPEDKTALWADYDNAILLKEVFNTMVGLRRVGNNMVVPRLGVISLILQETPTYVYNHPALNKLCRTAFTDGIHVFINEDFMKKLLADVQESRGKEFGLEPLIMHEVMHKMFNHVDRLKQFGPDIANRAADLSINTKLLSAFPEITWCKSLRETGLGFKPGDQEKYLPLSEESIARELVNEELKKKMKEQQQQQGGQGQGKGQGQSKGQSQNGQSQNRQGGQPQSGQGGQPQSGQSDQSQESNGGDENTQAPSDDFNGENDNHLITPKDLIEALEEAGLYDVKDMLNLPDSDEIEEIGRVVQEAQDRQHEAIQKAASDAAKCGGKYPGQHIVDCAAEYLKNFGKARLTWKLAMRDAVLGDGMKFKGSFEHISDIANVKSVTKALGNRLILPTILAHKSEEVVIVLVDTSGSVSDEDLRTFFAECFELKNASENGGDKASEVYIFSADTVARGEPIAITEDNVDELMSVGVKVFGRGGTDFGQSLRDVLDSQIMKDKKPRSIVYFTDLYDNAPKAKDLGLDRFPEPPNVVFVAAETTHSPYYEEWARKVESWARVVSLKEGGEVDLEDTLGMKVSPSRR